MSQVKTKRVLNPPEVALWGSRQQWAQRPLRSVFSIPKAWVLPRAGP